MQYLFARLREPSTWRGLSILLGALGVGVAPEAINQIGVAVGAVIASIEIIRAET